ncbi:MAG: 6,7-dimethyl-8-ribityllumazine synthase [Bacteriovoracaceae bacterium]|jgi:6,7-dimethyl-8-ribityllumazine synthase|nr:6,7-dimethyl-8-ribityllumazine synthase [Bacteriovoracaceae bacterium]
MNTYEGHLNAEGQKMAVIVARFNELIGSKLLSGAIDCFTRHGGAHEDMGVHWVPGAFEIPLLAKKLAQSGKYDSIICLGAVIRGATSHYDVVTSEVSKGIANVSLETDTPVIFGVLTTDTIEQSIERAGTKSGNKGWESALSGIEMSNLLKRIE